MFEVIKDLGSCPFCGGGGFVNHDIWNDGKFMFAIDCMDCGAGTGAFETLEEAIRAWNRRVC